VALGKLTPDDVEVQLYFGALDANRDIAEGKVIPMQFVSVDDGRYSYQADMRCETSGLVGYVIRVIPRHPDVRTQNELLSLSPGAER
jgi:glycogen phosphorylase